MKYTEELLDSSPFDFSEKNKAFFLKSFIEMSQHHCDKDDYTNYIWKQKNLKPSDIEKESDLSNAPFILVNQFKENNFKSSNDIVLTLSSSGTSGQRSVQYLDQRSLDSVKRLAFNIHRDLGITSDKKYNYLCFTYDPKSADDLGTAFTDELLTSFTKKNEVYYTFKYDEKIADFKMNEFEIVETLKRFEKSELPTRILGFPAFLYEIITKNNLQLNLGQDSWVQTGGGWKSKSDKEIPKEKFRKIISSSLGIPVKNIRDLFGMVEHGIPYVDCIEGRLRIPNYARVYIRDPETLKILPVGQPGLIQFICTYNSSYPAMNILTTDWGKLRSEDSISEFSLEILGRAGIDKNKGCALKALEMFEVK